MELPPNNELVQFGNSMGVLHNLENLKPYTWHVKGNIHFRLELQRNNELVQFGNSIGVLQNLENLKPYTRHLNEDRL